MSIVVGRRRDEAEANEPFTPDRRLDAIADIFARALGRLVLASTEDPAAGEDEASQPLEISPGSTLIDGQSGAVMVAGASRRGAGNGGRT